MSKAISDAILTLKKTAEKIDYVNTLLTKIKEAQDSFDFSKSHLEKGDLELISVFFKAFADKVIDTFENEGLNKTVKTEEVLPTQVSADTINKEPLLNKRPKTPDAVERNKVFMEKYQSGIGSKHITAIVHGNLVTGTLKGLKYPFLIVEDDRIDPITRTKRIVSIQENQLSITEGEKNVQ